MQRMTISRHYSRSPITEAILDFQVELTEGVELSNLERCQDKGYPIKKTLTLSPAPGGFGGETPTPATLRRVGFLFASADEKQLFQARRDGFTMHRLAPYQGWEPFREEARRLWDIYRRMGRLRKVRRVALRYVNQLDLPLPIGEIKEFLQTFPEVAPDLPQALAGFGMELNVPLPDIKSTLLLRERVVPPATPKVASVVLDIDLFRSDEIPSDDAKVWAFLETLHIRKNAVFEACITDRVREVIH